MGKGHKPPKKHSLKHDNALRFEGAACFQAGMSYDQNPYGSFLPKRRLLWSEGFNAARAAALLRNIK